MKKLIENIIQSSTDTENWGNVLDSFNETFNVSASSMFNVHEFENARLNLYVSQFHRKYTQEEAIMLLKSGGDSGDRPGYDFLTKNLPQKFYEELQLFNVNDYENLPPSEIRDLCKRFGFITRTGAALNINGPWIDGFFCQHRSLKEVDSFVTDQRISIILPIIANTITLNRIFHSLRERFQASLSALDMLGLAVFLIDETGCVIEQNKEAKRILDKADGLSLAKNKRLKLHSQEQTKALDSMINTASGLFHGEFEKMRSLMAASRPSGAYDYLISVRCLSDSYGELERGLKSAFVTVIDPERKNALSTEGIAILGQLSDAEREVADLLVQGFRLADVAEHRNVSLNTVKTQLKVISEKLRCSTQSDIIRIAAATRVPIEKK